MFPPAYSRLTAHKPDLYIIFKLVMYSLMTTAHLETRWDNYAGILQQFRMRGYYQTLPKYQKY